jgi:hypothetical protein
MSSPEPADSTVWQYTSAQGVLGILSPADAKAQAKRRKIDESKLPKSPFSMRFTEARYLNDPMELRFGASILAECLETEKEARTDLQDDDAEEIDGVIDWLREIDENPSAIHRHQGRTYVACFSNDKDSLSQWRGYAGRPGYAVGFDPDQLGKQLISPILSELQHKWEADFHLTPIVRPVAYGKRNARKWFQSEVAPAIVGAPILFTAPGAPVPRRVLAEAALAGVKQRAYKVEHEYRAFIRLGPTPVHREFRAGPDGSLGIIPYITASRLDAGGPEGLPPLITEIVVGPGEDIELRRAAVQQAVDVHAEGLIPVTTSAFQYRG